MARIISFVEFKVDAAGKREQYLRTPSRVKLNSRKVVFEYLEKLDEKRTARWKPYLKEGERIECEQISIQEPKIAETALSNGKVSRKLVGYETFTKAQYSMTYCRICGRVLTDPVSAARGIGPECIKSHPFSYSASELSELLAKSSERSKKIANILDRAATHARVHELIELNRKEWVHSQQDLKEIGFYIMNRFGSQ